jgi:hypothetical protein
VVIALDVHLEDRGVMHQTVDDGDGHRQVREDLAQPPNGWLAVMSSKRRSLRAGGPSFRDEGATPRVCLPPTAADFPR